MKSLDRLIVKKRLVVKDGQLMAILRPADAEKALALEREIRHAEKSGDISFDEAHKRFDQMLDAQTYTFAGLPNDKGDLFEPTTAKKCGRVQPGDSFVAFEDVVRLVTGADG